MSGSSQQPTRETATDGASRLVVGYGWASPLTERRDWFGSTTGLGGRRKFGGALVERREGVAKKPTSRKGREKWGTRHPVYYGFL